MNRFKMVLAMLVVVCVMMGAGSTWAAILLDDQFNAPNGTALDATKWQEVYYYTQQDGSATASATGGQWASIATFGGGALTYTWEVSGVKFGSNFADGRARLGLFVRHPGGVYEGPHFGTHSSGVLLVIVNETWGTAYALTPGTAYDLRMEWTPSTYALKAYAKESASSTWELLLELNDTHYMDSNPEIHTVPGTSSIVPFSVEGGTPSPSVNAVRVYDNSTGTLTGQITLDDYQGDVSLVNLRVELMSSGSVTNTYNTRLDGYGNYTVDGAPTGMYDIAFRAAGWLGKIVPGQTITGLTTCGTNLVNGDSDGSNVVTTTDVSIVLKSLDAYGE